MNLYDFIKRIIDILGALVGIIIFSPIMAMTTLHIFITSPTGPILADMKKRMGRGGKEFRMFKFRSMIPNAQRWLEDHPELYKKYQESGYKLDPDPRLIKGGNFIRKTSIDELPQFFNILFGDMSLVGPRAYFKYELDEQRSRHPETASDIDLALTVKPGLTGIWQTSGRSEIGFVERIKMDSTYAKRRDILYDLLIILKTPLVVLKRKGAI